MARLRPFSPLLAIAFSFGLLLGPLLSVPAMSATATTSRDEGTSSPVLPTSAPQAGEARDQQSGLNAPQSGDSSDVPAAPSENGDDAPSDQLSGEDDGTGLAEEDRDALDEPPSSWTANTVPSAFTCTPTRGSLYSLGIRGEVMQQAPNGDWAVQLSGSSSWTNAAKNFGKGAFTGFSVANGGRRAQALVTDGASWSTRQRGRSLEKLLVYTPESGFIVPFTFTSNKVPTIDGVEVPKIDSGALIENPGNATHPMTYWISASYNVAGKTGVALFAWDMTAAEIAQTSATSIASPFTLRARFTTEIPYTGPTDSNQTPTTNALTNDGQGGLFVTVSQSHSTADTTITTYSLTSEVLTWASASTPIATVPPVLTHRVNLSGQLGLSGVAFDPFGYMYVGGSSGVVRRDLYTGSLAAQQVVVGYNIAGIASCQYPPTIEVSKNLARFQAGDQFTLKVRRPGTGSQGFVGEVTTAGLTNGLQDQKLLVPVTDAARTWSATNGGWIQNSADSRWYPNFSSTTPYRYLVTESTAGTTAITRYTSRFSCTGSTGAELANGSGMSVSAGGTAGLPIPAPIGVSNFTPRGANLKCLFTNSSQQREAYLTADVTIDATSLERWGEKTTPTTYAVTPQSWSDRISATPAPSGTPLTFRYYTEGWSRYTVPVGSAWKLSADTPPGLLSDGFTYGYSWTGPQGATGSGAEVDPRGGDLWTGNVAVQVKPAAMKLRLDSSVSPVPAPVTDWELSATQDGESLTQSPGSWGSSENARAGTWQLHVHRTDGAPKATYSVEGWSCVASSDSQAPQPIPVDRTVDPVNPGEHVWTVKVLNGQSADCSVTLARTQLAVLVHNTSTVEGQLVPNSAFAVTAIPEAPYAGVSPALTKVPGADRINAGVNAVYARPGAVYSLSQERLAATPGDRGQPTLFVGLQRYAPDGAAECPSPDPVTATQPSMDPRCWVEVSGSPSGTQITIEGAGDYQVYRFVNTSISGVELPNAGGFGSLGYWVFGATLIGLFASAGWARVRRRQSRR